MIKPGISTGRKAIDPQHLLKDEQRMQQTLAALDESIRQVQHAIQEAVQKKDVATLQALWQREKELQQEQEAALGKLQDVRAQLDVQAKEQYEAWHQRWQAFLQRAREERAARLKTIADLTQAIPQALQALETHNRVVDDEATRLRADLAALKQRYPTSSLPMPDLPQEVTLTETDKLQAVEPLRRAIRTAPEGPRIWVEFVQPGARVPD